VLGGSISHVSIVLVLSESRVIARDDNINIYNIGRAVKTINDERFHCASIENGVAHCSVTMAGVADASRDALIHGYCIVNISHNALTSVCNKTQCNTPFQSFNMAVIAM